MVRVLTDGGEMVVLSPRETEVLRLTTEGFAQKEIAYRLEIRVCTVKKIHSQIRRGLGLGNLHAVVAWAVYQPKVFERQAVRPDPFRVPTRMPARLDSHATTPLPISA